MTEGFHHYPMEERIGARMRASRLDRLARQSGDQLRVYLAGRKVVLALSYGKDSMVCLDLIHRSGLLSELSLVMWNRTGFEPEETLAFRDHVRDQYGLGGVVAYEETVPEQETLERTLSGVDPSAKHPTSDFVYECLEQPRWRMMDAYEISGTIMGLRQDESRARRMSIAQRGTQYWNRREKAEICLPVARWTTRDIFEYAASREVPLHPIYHRAPPLGFPRDRVRLSSPVDIGMRDHGQLVMLRRLYPETWAAYAQLVPAIRDYA